MDMSDKNVHRGAQQQWPKTAPSTTTPTPINVTIGGSGSGGSSGDGKAKHLHTPYDLTGILPSNLNPYAIGLVGLTGSSGAAMPEILTQSHANPNSGYARFQPPPIHTHTHAQPTGVVTAASPGVTSLTHAPPSATTSNVPVFVPPAFSAAPTSVLTPNPFATTVSGNTPSNITPSHFALEHQFQPQHLSKIMNAVNSAASLANTSNALVGGVAGTAPFPVTLLGHTAQAQAATMAATATSATAVAAHSPQANRTPTIEMNASTSSTTAGGGSNNSASTITTTIAENVLSAICANANPNAAGVTPVHGRLLGMGVRAPDEEKMRRIQSVIEAGVSDHSKQQILQILDRISTLKPIEKLLLYLRLPGEAPETDPLRHPQNPLGTRSEINHTINWVRSHLEHDPQVSIPKQDVYNDYIAYCERLEIKPLSTADFGKVMKQVFPGIRPRRLGTRGHSRYCYAAMRKTTKLTPPQLPQLSTVSNATASADGANDVDETAMAAGTTITGIPLQTADSDTWLTVKSWAETLLNVKLDNVDELAARIKTNNALGLGPLPTNMAKKYAQREPKEKRQQVDMGPLKKRRKKKRKGSSSSESSQCTLPQGGGGNGTGTVTSPSTTAAPNAGADMQHDQEQKPIKMVKVKQEIPDSPNYAHIQQLSATAHMQTATLTDAYLDAPHQQQMMPMNLAPEQRTTAMPNKMPITTTTSSAVKNLTPKIMEMAGNATPSASNAIGAAATTATPKIAPPSIPITTIPAAAPSTISEPMPAIKEEIIDDYNPTNIICKKVRKAQQTKGFLAANSPIVTTSASSPPIATTVISSNATPPPPAVTPVAVAADTPNVTYSMGPPAQMISSATNSISHSGPSTSTLTPGEGSTGASTGGGVTGTSVIPKVASRNWSQLRAKRLQMNLAAAAAAAEANANELAGGDKDADLPDSLGLPRERVISICNMDKHELDDYFLPGDEESQDQDTELLQYFQTGDAEDKLNSLDATKVRTPTAAQLANMNNTNNNNNNNSTNINNNIGNERKPPNACVIAKHMNTATNATTVAIANMHAHSNNGGSSGGSGFMAVDKNATAAIVTPMTITTTTVGSASASLALMSQKHQHQQQQEQTKHQLQQTQQLQQQLQQHQQSQQQPIQQQSQIGGNKRKISFDYGQRLAPARKNCIFMPITSPNTITNSHTHTIGAVNGGGGGGGGSAGAAAHGGVTNGSFFASPSAGLTRTRSKPTFSKQQSLDCEDSSAGSDPMICANRRRRSYANYTSSNTSASAPPSPSVLQQQQRELFGTQAPFFAASTAVGAGNTASGVSWALGNGGVAGAGNYNNQPSLLAAEQNSIDLDLFGASGGCSYTQNASLAIDTDECLPLNAAPLSETQRSQSVPLSQLQRIHSPTFNRIGGIGGGGGGGGGVGIGGFQNVSNYSACASVAPTPVPPEFGENTLFSENSNSQHSLVSHNNNNNNSSTNNNNHVNTGAGGIKLDDTVVLASDSTAMLDEMDVNDILSSSDFVSKFSSIAQANSATTTTCSSSGSSSGYSSAGGGTGGVSSIFSGVSLNTSFGSSGGGGGGGGGIISRSVPSTPLPHHHQNIFGSVGVYGRRRGNDESHLLSPTGLGGSPSTTMSFRACTGNKYGIGGGGGGSGSGGNGAGGNNNNGSRFIYDISKSMPTTPITTPCFRYSPSDFLINGIDTFGTATSSGGGGSDSLLMGSAGNTVGSTATGSADDIVSIGEALIDGDCGVDAEVFNSSVGVVGGPGPNDTESIMVGADLLSNL